MGDTISAVNEMSAQWANAMWSVVWQATLLAVAVAMLLGVWRGLSPAARCWIWRLVAIKLLILPFWAVHLPPPNWFTAPSTPAPDAAHVTVASNNLLPPDISLPPIREIVPNASPITATIAPVQLRWSSWIAGVWLAVILLQLARIGWQRAQLAKLLAASRPANEYVRRLVADCSAQLRLRKTPEVLIADTEASPFVCRIARPLLVLPESLATVTSRSQLRQITLHELAHVRRHDLTWCWLTQVMRMAYWFHPVAHWVAFREALERELACDEFAMAGSGTTAADYAQTLIEAASRTAMPAILRAAAAAQLDGGRRLL